MNNNLTQDILDVVKNVNKNDDEYLKYSNALDAYKKMIEEGKIKPRGNCLIAIEDRFRYDVK